MSLSSLVRKLALAVAFAGAVAGCAKAPSPVPVFSPCAWEEERDNRATASLMGGTFNDISAADWQYRLAPGASAAEIEKTLAANGYKKFNDPFHDGDSYMKTVNGRWYHYIVHADGRLESHWEKSKPASLSHMREFWKSWNRPPDSLCDALKPK